MMLNSPDVIDRLTRVAPLGVRFFDAVTKKPVGGLAVTARATSNPARRIAMFANPSGVYVLQNVPALRDFENGEGDEAFWVHIPTTKPYIVEARDPRGQFLPCTFEAAVPTHRLFQWTCGPGASPLEPGDTDVPLFSAPARAVPEGMAVLRGDLYDPVADVPAAWAVLAVSYEGRLLGRGIADQRGQVSLIFAYPPPVDFEPLSPMVTGVALWQQQWTLQLRVGYAPAPAVPDVLDLCVALDQLASRPADIWTVWTGPAGTQKLTEAVLKYGQALILRSLDAVGGKPLARLFVTPA
jgi:hypothetical protein